MALPSTGGTYEDILEPGLNDLTVRKGIITDILIRDYNGSTTSLANPAVGLNDDGIFSPFAEDGQLRDDLLYNADGPNLGFYHIGLLTEDGITFATDVQTSETGSAQRRRPVRIDVESENDTIQFSAEESTPLIDWLNDDKPLLGLPDLGAIGYYSKRPAVGNIVERQIIALMFDGKHRSAKVYPRMARTNVGDTNWNKSERDRSDLTYGALLCPYAKYPVNTLREGEGWRALGGYPNFGLVAPVATATGAGAATVAHATPSGVADLSDSPFWTYAVKQATTSAGPWTTATISGSVVSGGNVTHTLSGLTAGAKVFKVEATGSNGLSGESSVSNSVTITS